MEIEKININDIHPAEYNPRIMPVAEMEKLKKGLQAHGLIDPIIIDLTDNNTVIGGHQRLEALKEIDIEDELTLIRLGDMGLVLKETDIQIKDKNQQKAMNLALNKIQGEWDYDLLDNIITELTSNNYDIELTGFDTDELLLNDDEWDLTDIDDQIQEEQQETEPKEETPYTPLKEVNVKVESGDKYQLGDHILLCADSKDMKNIKDLISDETVDLILTDPPYGIDIVNSKGQRERERA